VSDRTAKRASIREEREAIDVYNRRKKHVKSRQLKKAISLNDKDEHEHLARLRNVTLAETMEKARG